MAHLYTSIFREHETLIPKSWNLDSRWQNCFSSGARSPHQGSRKTSVFRFGQNCSSVRALGREGMHFILLTLGDARIEEKSKDNRLHHRAFLPFGGANNRKSTTRIHSFLHGTCEREPCATRRRAGESRILSLSCSSRSRKA